MALRQHSTPRRLRLYVFARDPVHTNAFAMRAPSDRDSETDVCVLSHHSTRRRLRRLVFTIDLRALTRPSPTYPPARAIPQRLTMALRLYSTPQRLRLYVLVIDRVHHTHTFACCALRSETDICALSYDSIRRRPRRLVLEIDLRAATQLAMTRSPAFALARR
jgi:hypothetical protein